MRWINCNPNIELSLFWFWRSQQGTPYWNRFKVCLPTYRSNWIRKNISPKKLSQIKQFLQMILYSRCNIPSHQQHRSHLIFDKPFENENRKTNKQKKLWRTKINNYWKNKIKSEIGKRYRFLAKFKNILNIKLRS